MSRPYILAENHWKTLQKNRFDLALLPWGATEAHNFHLPYATDNIEAEAIAAESARIAWENGAKVVVLPTVPFGVNTGQSEIYLDLNLNPSTQLAIIADILTVLERQGLHRLLIFNSHGGNDFKAILRELGLRFPKMFLATCNWFSSLDKAQYFEEAGDHADEMETSLMLHLRPDLVLPLSEAGAGTEKTHQILAFREKWAWTERKWHLVTKDTGIGNPANASAAKGKRYFHDVTQKIADFITELASIPSEKHYL
ncbi:MAG: creatininase family protein [Bacteroidetes Order II. Incertae sedis bacterium]|nr:creatininase family protein [Bacteroidetes Order II. bacterium]